MYQGGQTFLPLRVNQAGVIPIIFAVSILLFPSQIARYFTARRDPSCGHRPGPSSRGSAPARGCTSMLYFLLTFGFTYFYTAFTFKPDETAEQLRKNGGFIPGIRPGRPTQDYLARVVTRITVAGALFLGLVAASPPLIGLVQPDFQNIAPGWHGPADRGVRRRRDDEAARGAAPDPPVRGVHPMIAAAAAAAVP